MDMVAWIGDMGCSMGEWYRDRVSWIGDMTCGMGGWYRDIVSWIGDVGCVVCDVLWCPILCSNWSAVLMIRSHGAATPDWKRRWREGIRNLLISRETSNR